MGGPAVAALLFLSALCAYAMLNHLSFALRRPIDRTHLFFAGMCGIVVGFGLSHIAAYQASSVAGYIRALKWNLTFVMLFFILLPWFITSFTGFRWSPWRWISTIVFGILTLVNLLCPYSLQFTEIPHLISLHLPWGETICEAEGHAGILFWFAAVAVLLTMGVSLWTLVAAWRRDRAPVSFHVVMAMALFIAAAGEGVLVRASIIDFIHLGPYACLLTIVIISLALSRDTSQRLALLDFALNNVHEAAFLSDRSGRLRYVNEEACHALGYSREELLELPVTAIDLDCRSDRRRAQWETLRKTGSLTLEGRHRTRDGHILPVEINANYFTYAGHGYNLALARDMTRHYLAEAALKKERQRFYDVLETLPVMICLLTPDYRVAFANRSFRKKFGESDGRRCHDYIFGSETPCQFCESMQVIQTGRPHHWELAAPDGSVFDVHDFPFTDVDGSQMILEMDIDITHQKQAIETLQDRERFIRNILETVDEGFIVLDRDYRILSANRAYCLQVGLPEDRVIGRKCSELSHSTGKQCFESGADCPVRRAFETGTAHAASHSYLNTDREKRHVEIKSYPIPNASGTVDSVIETITDVTDNRRLEAQLQQAQKMEAIGTLAGGVAHDFNNMLSVIIGFTELALEQVAPSLPLYENLQEIRIAAGRSAELTRQLLTFARKQIISPKVLYVNETVSGILKMLQRLIGEQVNIKWRPGKGLWPVRMDPSQIDQILANLCVNSRDAIAGTGVILIETQNASLDEAFCIAHPEASAGQYVLLTVSDNGCGMDAATLAKIFEPFFTTKELGKGTGLGLATVYGIIKQNHGFINVYSEPVTGTTFNIYLPRHVVTPEQAEKPLIPDPLPTGNETVLIVEDASSILNMVTRMLENFGYRVLAASSPTEAIRIAREHPDRIHVLLTDVVMPEMNGRELARTLEEVVPGIKCLFMSGYMGDVITELGMLEKHTHFIQKPFSRQTLAAKLRETVEGA
jgi:PAS domain S-box-containing protein